jgi:hypothetical protein
VLRVLQDVKYTTISKGYSNAPVAKPQQRVCGYPCRSHRHGW